MLNTFAVKRSLLKKKKKQLKLEHCSRKRNYFHIVQSNVHYKQMVTASWSKSVTVDTLQTGTSHTIIKILQFTVRPALIFSPLEVFFTA